MPENALLQLKLVLNGAFVMKKKLPFFSKNKTMMWQHCLQTRLSQAHFNCVRYIPSRSKLLLVHQNWHLKTHLTDELGRHLSDSFEKSPKQPSMKVYVPLLSWEWSAHLSPWMNTNTSPEPGCRAWWEMLRAAASHPSWASARVETAPQGQHEQFQLCHCIYRDHGSHLPTTSTILLWY